MADAGKMLMCHFLCANTCDNQPALNTNSYHIMTTRDHMVAVGSYPHDYKISLLVSDEFKKNGEFYVKGRFTTECILLDLENQLTVFLFACKDVLADTLCSHPVKLDL